MTSFLCFYCKFWTYFRSFSSVSLVDFEQVNTSWEIKITWTYHYHFCCHYHCYPIKRCLLPFQTFLTFRKITSGFRKSKKFSNCYGRLAIDVSPDLTLDSYRSEQIQSLFEVFYQAKNILKSKQPVWLVELSLVKNILTDIFR